MIFSIWITIILGLLNHCYQVLANDPVLNTYDRVIRLVPPPSRPAVDSEDGKAPSLPNQPLPLLSESWKDPSSLIFVGIAHYRDQRCATTLFNLFSKAKYPNRLRIGIVQQIHTEGDGFHCLQDFCHAYPQYCKQKELQFRVLEYTHQMARGPYYARHLQASLIDGTEEYCLQIDAHMDFVEHWDVETLEMFASINNEYAVLSFQPSDISAVTKTQNSDTVPHLCQAEFNSDGLVVNLPPCEAKGLTSPLLAPLYSSTFAFSRCHAEKKALNDPNLLYLFDGDDFVKFARLWTHGYDVYTPSKVLAYHDYQNTMKKLPGTLKRYDALGSLVNTEQHAVIAPSEWSTRGRNPPYRRQLYENTLRRVRYLLGEEGRNREALQDLSRYGLGTKRSWKELQVFTGIDLSNRKVVADRCKALQWVSYHYDEDPEVSTGDVWGLASEVATRGGRNLPFLVDHAMLNSYPSSSYTKLVIDASSSADIQGEIAPPRDVVVDRNEEHPSVNPGKEDEAHVHYGKELWSVFQAVDTFLEDIVYDVEIRLLPPGSQEQPQREHVGKRALKLVLVVAPLFVVIVFLAFYVLCGGSLFSFMPRNKYFTGGLKRI